MVKHPTKLSWTEEQNRQLVALVADGKSPTRAAAIFNRSILSVQLQARRLGAPFPPRRLIKAQQRALEQDGMSQR